MSNISKMLYTGITSDLERRVKDHRHKRINGYTSRYTAIAREKQIKGWRRAKKVALIESVNPTWKDLSDNKTE